MKRRLQKTISTEAANSDRESGPHFLVLGFWSFSGAWILAFGAFIALFLSSCSLDEKKVPISEIKCYPPTINLVGTKARQSVVVQATYSDGITRDVTYDARC